jgi:pentatricopeptide repeat protein
MSIVRQRMVRVTASVCHRRLCGSIAAPYNAEASFTSASSNSSVATALPPLTLLSLVDLRELKLALTFPDELSAELPVRQICHLGALYASLISPLPLQPTQLQQIAVLRRVNTSASAFFDGSRDAADPAQHAYRIQCLGAKLDLEGAHDAFNEMWELGAQPDGACFRALAEACARSGDAAACVDAIRGCCTSGLPLNAPLFTSLLGAHRTAGDNPREGARRVLEQARRLSVVEDAPLHTAVICWHLEHDQADAAWKIYHESRVRGIQPDAVTYTAMLGVCARSDQLELATNLLDEMRLAQVAPTLATYNAFLRACATRAASLAELPRRRRRELSLLKVDLDVGSVVRSAFRTLETLTGQGYAPDGSTYRALLMVAAGAADVPRAQTLLTRMLDTNVPPDVDHFHLLLHACGRAQRLRPIAEHEGALRVALSTPVSMAALGLPVEQQTLDRVLEAHTRGSRIHRAVDIADELYVGHGLVPGQRAFALLLGMSQHLRHPRLGAHLLQRMAERGIQPSEEQRALPARLTVSHVVNTHPPLPVRTRGARCGFLS